MQLVECVPNISEGRDASIIEQIAQEIVDTNGAYLLHKDSGYDVNRTVLTFAGSPSAVSEAAFRLISKASELIDMSSHRGSHPRIGATDVCPIIPLINTTMHDCISLSKLLAEQVGRELDIPVYLYGESATSPERKSLSYIRGGEYENLFLRIDELVFKPDFGPVVCNFKSGATAIGARKILIAFNVHLDTKDLSTAKKIAQAIRELRQKRQKMDISFNEIRQTQSQPIWQEIQAIGWYVDEYKCCQISLNLLDYKKTSLHAAFLGVSRLASEFGVSVTGSEIIGLSPLAALLDAGKFVATEHLSEQELLNTAINFLKLNCFKSFKTEEKVLEYRLKSCGLTLPSHLD